MTSDDDGSRRRFGTAWAAGAAAATLAFAWMVTEGTGDLLRYQRVNSDFYEAQARSFVHGRLDIPVRTLGLEAFSHAGRTYTYFPPFPAVLRVPIVTVTDALDGRLATTFVLIAFILAMVGSGVLTWRIRSLLRPGRPIGRSEAIVVGAFALLVGCGSPLFFPSSRPWVYHEAAIWGMAFAVCGFDQVLAFVRGPTVGRLVRASAFGAAALLSRPPIGAGVMAALALVLVVAGITRLRPAWTRVARVTGVEGPMPWPGRWLGGLAAAIAVPVVVYVAINMAKFGTPLSVPYDAQLQNLLDPHRRRVLAANDGSLFTLAAVPTQVWQLVRPDALRLGTTFPFVGAATFRPRVVGSLLFDQRDYTASLTAAMPGLVLLAIAGAVRVCRAGAAALRLPVIGAAVVLPVSWSFLYVAQRYASDCFPLLLLLAAAGLAGGLNRLEQWSSSRRRTAVVAFAVVVAFGAWTGLAIALEYQRNLAPLVADDLRREYVSWQWDVADVVGVGHPQVEMVDALGAAGARDALAVLPRCAAVYVSDGSEWRAAERTGDGGRYRLAVRFASAPRGTLEPILTIGDGPDRFLLAVRYRADDTAVLTTPGHPSQGTPFTFDPARPTVLDIVVDPNLGELRVTRGRRVLLGAGYAGPAGSVTVGRDPAEPSARFGGGIERLPTPPGLCRKVTGDG